MTSLATAVGGMKHWDWCPICRGGLDTGLECDQCGADLMPIYKAFKDHQARPTDSAVLRAIKARADRSRLGYGGKAWVTSDPKSEVVEDRMILIEIVCRQELAINRLCAALNEAADSFKNAGLSVDAEDCERVIEESLSGGNPGEPKACTGAEERGISGATGAGQHPDGNPESTGDSADRRSPDGTERTPSPDESNRHFERGCHIIMELMQAYERRVRSDCTPEQIEKRPWECAEYLKSAEYLRNVWPPHEPQAARPFPIMTDRNDVPDCPRFIRWDALNEDWAHRNHNQTLSVLASRGGLSPCEAVAIIQRRNWRDMDRQEASDALKPFACAPLTKEIGHE